jgi:hypothetical protein
MVMIDKDAKGFKGNTPLKFGSSKSGKKSTSRTVVTPGTKVSQATIDKIKSMGMTAALKGASGASAEMKEGLRRLYGAKRVDAAMGPVNRKPSAPSAISNTLKRNAPGAISGRTPVKKSSAPGAVSGKMPVRVTQPKKATPAARPTASQIKAGESRAGGAYKYKPSKPPVKQVKTAAQKAKEQAATVARRKAAADAVKRAGGRTA